jgi:hypothetical protein
MKDDTRDYTGTLTITNPFVVYGDSVTVYADFISRVSSNIGALRGGIQDILISIEVVYCIDTIARDVFHVSTVIDFRFNVSHVYIFYLIKCTSANTALHRGRWALHGW